MLFLQIKDRNNGWYNVSIECQKGISKRNFKFRLVEKLRLLFSSNAKPRQKIRWL